MTQELTPQEMLKSLKASGYDARKRTLKGQTVIETKMGKKWVLYANYGDYKVFAKKAPISKGMLEDKLTFDIPEQY